MSGEIKQPPGTHRLKCGNCNTVVPSLVWEPTWVRSWHKHCCAQWGCSTRGRKGPGAGKMLAWAGNPPGDAEDAARPETPCGLSFPKLQLFFDAMTMYFIIQMRTHTRFSQVSSGVIINGTLTTCWDECWTCYRLDMLLFILTVACEKVLQPPWPPPCCSVIPEFPPHHWNPRFGLQY